MRTLKIPFPDCSFFEKTRLQGQTSDQLTVPVGASSLYFRNPVGFVANDWAILEAFESEDAEIIQVGAVDREAHLIDLLSGTQTYQEHAVGVIVMRTPYNMVKVYKGTTTDVTQHTLLSGSPFNLRPDNAYTYVFDSVGATLDYYSYKFYNSYGESIVVGTDTKNYRCVESHTSADINKPVTGANYAHYWAETTETGVAWSSSVGYVTGTDSSQVLCTTSDYDSILTVGQLKSWFMFGLDLTDDDGYPFPNSMFEFAIRAAVDSLQKTLQLMLVPTTILCEYQDFYAQDYRDFAFLQLNQWPVISVERIQIKYPTAAAPIDFPIEWVQLRKERGQIHLVPTSGSLSTILMGRGGDYLTFVWRGYDFMPNLWRIDYTAGFPAGQCPNDIVGIVGKMACFYPLNIAGDLVGGIAIASKSIGIDGLSQSINTTSSPENAGYSARLRQYERELKIEVPRLIQYYKAMRVVAL